MFNLKYTTQKKLRVKEHVCLHLCEHHFGGYMTFFHQGNKLVSNRKFFVCFLFVSHERRHTTVLHKDVLTDIGILSWNFD